MINWRRSSVELSWQHLRRSTCHGEKYSEKLASLEFGSKFQREVTLVFEIPEFPSNSLQNKRGLTLCSKNISIRSSVLVELRLVVDRLVAWHSGRTSVCDRRTFPVLCSTCSWWVTTHVGKPSTTRSANWANSAFHPFDIDKWVVSCNRMCATSIEWRHLVNAYGVKTAYIVHSIRG